MGVGLGGEAHLLSCMNLRPSAAPIRMPTSTIAGGMKVPCARETTHSGHAWAGGRPPRRRPHLRLIVIVLYLLPHALLRVVVHPNKLLTVDARHLEPLEQVGDVREILRPRSIVDAETVHVYNVRVATRRVLPAHRLERACYHEVGLHSPPVVSTTLRGAGPAREGSREQVGG